MNERPSRSSFGASARAAATFVLLLAAGSARADDAAGSFHDSALLFIQRCAQCHTLGGGRGVGPDLTGVTSRRAKDWLIGFIQNPDSYLDKDADAQKLLAEYGGVRMENVHVTKAQAEGLVAFIQSASQTPSPELRYPDEGWHGFSVPGLLIFAVLAAGTLVVMIFGARRDAAVLAVFCAAAAYWGFGGWRYFRLPGDQQGHIPPQPIAFSHELHAGRLTISCLYCHGGAQRSDVAGVPPLSVCMNCHVAVRSVSGAKEPSPEIAKIVAAYDASVSSPTAPGFAWNRVHHLPDYVHFSHRAHIANNLQCQECHGPVQTMTRLRQAAPLTMGWCVNCHRLTPKDAPSHWKRVGGPLDCAACHF